MGTKRKALRYGMRKQDFSEIKRRDGIATSMKLLRSVLAVGFAMTPWLGSEAFAAGIERIDGINLPDGLSKNYLQGDKDTVAHIYAEQANDTVGLNRFKTFDVGANQIANLYFHTSANAPAFNTLVNTVQEQINISGTVNALRNNKIGGNLYFLSPKGMVVGSKGVINAGSLTVMTSTQGFNDDLTAANAAEKLAGTIPMDNDGSITIHGQINAMTGIDLRAAHIALQKDSKGEGTPLLQTGVVFNNIVNNNVFERADVRTDVKLAVTKDSEGNVTFAYSPNTSNETLDLNEATGDGSIKLQAEATQRNRCFNIFTVDPNNPDANWTDKDTVEAKVDLGARSTVASAGDVTITATATRQNDNNPIEFWDILTYTNAEINVDGNVSGQNVAVSAKATSSFTGSNNASTLYVVDNRTTQIINNNNEKIDVDINNSLTDAIMNKLLEKQILGEKTKYLQTATNIIQSLYMPFSFVDAKASVNQSVDSVIQSTGNLNINAESSATNKLTAAIQHKVTTGSNPISMPIGGGFVYVQTGSEATVNLNGKAQAGGNLTVDARSTNTSVSSMALKKVKNIDTGDEATGGTGVDYCGVALAINFQDNNAVVNLGNKSLADKGSVEAPRIKADGNLKVNATTTDTVSSTALVATSSDSIVNTTINVIDSDGKAEINSHVPVKGSSVSMGSTELLNSLKATTDGSSGVELTGINYLISTAKVKQGVEKTLRPLLTFIEEVNRYSAGENINLETDAKTASGNKPAKTSSWRNYFSIGASVMVANVDNIATINIKPGASITSTTGDLSLASRVTIGDSLLITKNLLANEKKNSKVGVSSAIAVEDMHNTAEVNVESSEDEQTTLQAAGSVKATAEADQSYNRLEKMVEALEKGWAATDAYWTKPNGINSAQDVIQKVEAAVADLLTITAKDSATNLAQSKQHTAKAKAAVDLLAQLAGVDQLKTALEAFCDAANYTNMYVSSSTDKMDTPVAGDSTAMATGTVGIQNVDNNAAVKIRPKAIITAGNEKLVQLEANAVEQSFMMAGKWAFLPDIYTTDAGSYGIGGTVGVQNASSNSLVQVMDGVQIQGGAIDLATQNDVLNMALVMGGSHTSSLGITGMVSYQGGNSTAQTLVDDDASLTALQKKVALATADGSSSKEYQGVKLSADNNTIVIGIAGDLSSSNAISMGVSTSVIDYNVKSLAVMENQEDKDTEGEGLISASDVSVEAHTGGVINSLSVAGSKNDTSNTNKQGGGVSAATSGGQGAEGVEKIEAKASDKTDTPAKTDTTVKATDGNTTPTPAGETPAEATKNPVVELKAAGSVSVNYIVDETRAGIDSVEIAMQRFASGDMTTNLSIQAQDDSYIGAYSGAGALSKQGVDYQNNSKFSGMINGAVAFNEINKTTSASLNNSKLTNVDNVLNQSQNSGAQVALGLALGVDLAQRMDNASVNLGASGSFNFVNSTVQAVMEKDEILGASHGSLNVHNTAYDKDVQVAGGASAEYAGSAALGASVAVNEATNKIVARMQKTSIGDQNALAGSVNNLAVSNLVQVGGAISVGVTTSKSYAVGDVAVATNVLANEVQAEAKGVTIYAKSFNNEARDGKLNQSEEANAYLAEINSVPNTAIQVDATGQYYVLGTDNTKQYLNPQGSIHIYEEDGSPVNIFALEGGVKYDEETGALKDKDGKVIILNPNRYFTYANSDQKVDFYAPVTENIIDLDVNTALDNANGVVNENSSTGVDIALKKNNDGSVNAAQHYTSQNVTVTSNGNVIVGSAIAVAAKVNGENPSAGVAAATSVNDVTNSFTSSVAGSTISVSGVTDTATSTTNAVKVKADNKTVMVAVAAGAAGTVTSGGTATVDVAGSGVANTINNDTIAKVENSTIAAPKLAVEATTNATLVGVAGQLSAAITDSYGGVAGLTWAQNSFDNTTGAYVRGISLNGYNNGNTALNVNALNNSDMYTVGAGVSVAVANGAISGAYAANYGTNSTEAVVEKYTGKDDNDNDVIKNNTITNTSNVVVQAEDDSDIVAVAGSLDVAVSPSSAAATVGGVVANTQIGGTKNKQKVQASLDDADITMVAGADLSVKALNKANIANFALGGGVAVSTSIVGVSAEGSVSVVDINSDCLASMNNVNVSGSNNDVELLAQSNGDIVSSADAVEVAYGSAAGVAGGAAVSVLNSVADTRVEATNTENYGTWNVKNAVINSISNNDIFNLAMGLGVGASATAGVGVEGNVAVNNISNDTTISVDGASITATGDLGILANSNEHLQNYGGAMSVGAAGTAGVGVGAAVVVNTISGDTSVEVNNSNLAAQGSKGANDGIDVYNYTVTNDGAVSSSSTKAKGLVIVADSKHEIDNVTVTSSIGGAGVASVGVGVTADVNEISGVTKASVTNTNINKDANYVGDVYVLAHDKADISADVVNASGAGSGVGSATALGAAGTNIISRETRALIDGDTSTSATSQKVLNANNAKVYALGERRLRESVTGVGVAASGAGAGGLAATVSVVNLTDTNLAAVKNMAGTAHALTVDAERSANVHSYNNVIVATGGIGAGSAAVGVTVLDDKSSTQSMLTHTDLTHGGNYDTTSKVNVLANNNTHVETELGSGQISASIGAVGGVGVECVNMEALVGVTVDDATISKDAFGHAYKEFNALANNRLYKKFTNAIASGSTLGAVMVGVGDVNINSKTFTNINNVNAHADAIAVKANEYRTAEAVFVAASVAAGLTVGVSQLYTNIGDVLQGEYTYYRGDNVKDESQKIGTAQTGKYTTANFQKAVDDGLNGNSQVIASLKQKYAADIKSTTSQSMNRGNVDNVGLSTTVMGSTLQATNALAIEAMVTNSVNNTLEQVQASLGIIAVASNHVSVVEHQSLLVENTSLVADTISIKSNNTSALNSSVGTVPVGGTGYNDTTSYIKHSGDNELTVNGSNLKATYVADATTGNEEENSSNAAASLTINALNNTTINNSGHNVTVEGAAGGRLILEGEDASKATITLGNGTTSNSFKAAQIAVQAHNDPRVKNAVTTVNTGVLYGGGTIITSKASGGAALAIKDKNTFEANEVALLALSGKDTSATDTNDIKNTTEATGTAVSVTGGDITVNKARTYNNMNTSLTIGAVKFLNGTGYSDVVLGAQNWTSSRAAIETYNIGIVGSGSNFAQTHDSSSVSINVNAGNEGLYANNLTINALNNGAVQANAKGTDAGLLEISPFAAQVEHEAASTTNITLSGTITASGNMLTNAQRTDTVNVFADALSMTVAGGGDASASSDISSSTYVKTDDAQLTSAGDMQLQAENIVSVNKATGYEQMIYGQGSGVIKVDTAGVTNKVIAEAQVLVNDSSLLSKKGKIDIASHNQEDMNISGYIYSVGLISGCEADVENTITNYSKIDLDNSSISVNGTGNDLTISAADDLKLHTYAYSEVSPAVDLVNGTDANVKNELTRTNTIYVDNKSKLYGARDINLYAGKLLNGSLATLDLDVEACDFNASLIPIVLDPTVKNVINQNNQITISKGSSSGSARHTNLYADTGREFVRSYSCRYTGWGSSDVDGYVTTDSGNITDKTHVENYVNINGSVVAGVANKVGITIGNTGDIVVLDDSELGSAERDAVIGTAYSGDELKERSTVIADSSSGLTVDSLVLGREDYANELMNRYNEVVCLMSEYERDNTTDANGNTIYSPSYLGYKAEAERLRNEMLTRGFAKETKDANGNPQLVLIANMKVDYVELPELVASGGNITVDTSNLQSSGKTGVLKAQGVDGVTITNNTNLLLKVNAITMDAEGGLLIYNKQEMTGSDVSSINSAISAINENNAAGFAEIKTVDTASEGSGAISITGTYSGASISFKDPTDNITKEYLPLANIQVQGNVTNNIGNVNITSEHNSIVVQGVSVNDAVAITGREVHLNAGGSIIQGFTDGIVHIGGNPQLNDTYKTLYEGLKQNHTTVEQNYSNSDYGDAIGNYISGGAVYINATDINVNGVIQSGYADYSVDITGSDVENKIAALKSNYNGTGIISDNVITSGDNYKIINGGAVWDSTKGAYKYQLNVYYNPSTDKIIVEDVDASGGQIYLTGRISSTGNGKILCLNGLSNITVNNNLNYVMQLGNLTVNETKGLVKITDMAGGFTGHEDAAVRITTVIDGSFTEEYYNSNGISVGSNHGIGSMHIYRPAENLRYTWTSGDRYTTYTRYTEDIMDGGWGLWSRGATEEELANWSVSDNQVGASVPTGNVDRLNGETVVVTTSPDSGAGYDIYMKYSADTDSNVDYVKESEERYTSGFFGCHTHYVVTWTKSQGTSETYYASLKADMPFTIDFIGSSDSVINITSDKNNIELTGNIGNTQLYVDDPNYVDSNGNMSVEKGTVNIKANDGSIIRAGGSIYGQNITLAAAQDIENVNITAGDFVNLEAVNTASGQGGYKYDIKLDVERAHGTAGKVILETIGAATMVTNDNVTSYESVTNSTLNTGLVRINAEGDITQKNGVAISADRIDLNSEYGSIYGSGGGLRVYAGQGASSSDTLSASLNATAKGNISLTQLNGDMRLGRVYSKEGDVTLIVNNGSVVDALPYEDDSRGDLQALQARWQSIGIIAGSGNENLKNAKSRMLTQVMNSRNAGGVATQSYTYNYWNTNQLLYSLQNSIINQTSDSLPTTSVKDPNVIGKNITINAANGTVGSNTGTQTVITDLSNGNLEKLATANPATVTCVKDANGKITSATITDMQPIGIQQTVQTTIDAEGNKHTSMGSVVINSGDTDTSGGVFLEGREQDAEVSTVPNVTKDLQLQNINAVAGKVYLTSLGNIYNGLTNDNPVVNGKSLYITAVGSIGDENRALTTALSGTEDNEGLSSVAKDGVYIYQTGNNALRLIDVSSGGDIYLTSASSIVMGSVGGTNAVNYIRSENGGDIVLEARNGSIGAPAYESNGTIKHDENNGVRILNSDIADYSGTNEKAVNVSLKATQDIYVNGITNKVLQDSNDAGGYLNLLLDAEVRAAPKNVGVVVNGQLNLQDELIGDESVSIYTVPDLNVNNIITTSTDIISSKNVYLGSAGNVILNGTKKINGLDSISVEAGQNVLLKTGTLDSDVLNLKANMGKIEESDGFVLETPVLNATANNDILLNSKANQLQQVNVANANGNVYIVNGNKGAENLAISITTTGATINGDLTVYNYDEANGAANKIVLANNLSASGTIKIINEEADVTVGAGGNIKATNITLQAVNNNVLVAGGVLEASSKVLLDGVDVTISGEVKANTAELNAADDISLTGGSIIATTAVLNANGTIDSENNGSTINESDGFVLDANVVKAKAAGAISLASKSNQLVNVLLGNNSGNVTVYNGNTSNEALNIAVLNENAKINGNLTVNNYSSGAYNEIHINQRLEATGNIEITNDETGIAVNNSGAHLKAENIKLQADTASVSVGAGLVEAADIVTLKGKNIEVSGGEIKAQTATLSTDTNTDISGIEGNNVVISGGKINAATTNVEAKQISVSDGEIVAANATMNAESISLTGGSIAAVKADNTGAVNLTATAGNIAEGEGFALKADIINTSATGKTSLGSHANQLEKVNIVSAGDVVTIGSANHSNNNALEIATSNPLTVDLSVTNYKDAYNCNNAVLVSSFLQTSGNITLVNEETAIVVNSNGIAKGSNINLNASEITVNGSVQAQAAASLESGAGADLVLNGSGTVSGSTVNITSGQDFIHNGGTIAAVKDANIVGSGSATITAERNILLQAGSLQAGNATLTAVNGYITESYDKDDTATASDSYDLQVNQIQAAAGGADITGVAIDLGSRFNQLSSVVLGDAKGDVFIGNGAADSAGVLTIQAATIVEDNTTTYASVDGELVVHNYNNKSENDIGNNLRVLGFLNATEGISLINDERNITMGSLQATDKITSGGPIVIKAANNVRNAADIKSTGGAVSITAENDVINDGVVETASGEITLTSNNGMIFNSDNGDLITSSGDVSLLAKGSSDNLSGNSLEYFYYTDFNAQTGEFTKVYVNENETHVKGSGAGGAVPVDAGKRYIVVNEKEYTVFQKNSVYNAGDIIAMNGDITLQSDNGNVANFNDFKRFVPQFGTSSDETKYQDKDITNGSITMSAANGRLINNVDLEAGKDVTLIAKDGLGSFGYNIYAGENITLTATAGDLVNTSTLESVKGNITLTAEHGNVVNGTSQENRKGDIISLGGTVTLKAGLSAEEAEAKGQAVDTTPYNVTNYGDIISVNKNNPDDANAGSIVLKSERGSVKNFDDFNTYSKTSTGDADYKRTLDINKHKSVAGLSSTADNSYNVATSNITLSAVKGTVFTDKDYLVALGNVTMEAKEGIGSFGQVVLAGGNISLTDTDGDIFNRAQLISKNGDISLTAANGSVINMIDGDIYALDGNVTLNAKGAANDTVQYVRLVNDSSGQIVEAKALTKLVADASIPEGAIIVTQRGYYSGDTFIVLGNETKEGVSVVTKIGYLDANDNYSFKQVGSDFDYNIELFRAGDVVNRGDIVALKGNSADNTTNHGNVSLISSHGNAANYDEFGSLDNGADEINYSTATGITGVRDNIRFNQETDLNVEAHYFLAKANLSMEATEGYLYNTMDLTSGGDLSLISGKDLLLGVNVKDTITAAGDVTIESTNGQVLMNQGSVSSSDGSVAISGNTGVNISGSASVTAEKNLTVGSDNGKITIMGSENDPLSQPSVTAKNDLLLAAKTGITVQDSTLESINGSLSAAAMYGEVNIGELAAAEMVAVGSGSGKVTIGKVQGKDVVLYTEDSNAIIEVGEIKAQDSLVLQADQINVGNEVRSSDGGQLLVDITGADGGAMDGDLELDLAGDVRFTNFNVTNATINVEGAVGFDKLHTEGELHIVSQNMVTSVYGKTPDHDGSNYLYYDYSGESSSGNSREVIRARYFALDKAQGTMDVINDKIANAEGRSSMNEYNNTGWMYLYIDSPTYQRSNGLLLHFDTGYRSAAQRWSAEDLSAKLADYKPYATYEEHYGDFAGMFGRYDLVEIAPRPVSEIVHDVMSQRVQLQKDNEQLRLEHSEQEKQKEA